MKCSDFHQLMWQKTENKLTSQMQLVLESHLKECRSCALLFKKIEAQQAIIDAEKKLVPDDHFSAAVMKRISENKKPNHNLLRLQRLGYKALMAASIAAAIALGVSTATLLNTSEAVQSSDEIAYFDDSAIEGLETWLAE